LLELSMITRRRFVASSAALPCAGLGIPLRADGQGVGRASRIVVGFPPGGAPDVVARLMADALRGGSYAPTVIVENKPGAGGRIAAEVVKNSDADGSTVLVTPNPIITIYPHVYRKLAYDPLRELAPVTSLCSFPLVLSAGPALPTDVKSLPDLVSWAKAHPGSASFGTPAAGSTLHFIGVVFASAAGIPLEHVPYKGGPEVVNDLLGGRIALAVTPPAPVVPHIRSGRLRALATTSRERSALLPDVPTFRESGYPQLDMKDWIGAFVPARTPPDTIDRLNALLRAASQSPAVREAYASLMMEPGGESPRESARMVEAEYEMWRPIVKASGFVASD
jgi:tripartite-type tricarboxylate transporter receptor subunit TctC